MTTRSPQPTTTAPDANELVETGLGCPNCGEQAMDYLVCQDDGRIRCATCRMLYRVE